MRVVTTTTITNKLLSEWSLLWQRSEHANYTNSPAWFLSVLDSFPHTKYCIIAVYEGARLQAVAPLLKTHAYGVGFYAVGPADFVCGLPFLLDPGNQKVCGAIAEKLSTFTGVVLNNVPEDFVTLLQSFLPRLSASRQAINYSLPIIVDENGRCLINHRKKLMRQVRNCEEQLLFRSFDGTMPEGLDVAFGIDAASRKRYRGYSTFSDQQTKQFYYSLARHFRQHFIINILYFSDTPIAYEIGFIVGTTYFGNQIAYHAEYASYSPGKVMEVKLLESLHGRGICKMDFGSGDSLIKRMLATESQLLFRVVLTRNGLLRHYLLLIFTLQPAIYDYLHRHIRVYTAYRHIRNLLFRA